ncbi:MAG: glycosyltransferase family 39 protein [Desulfomonile tiedjei]|uniref:Glycosyltransferase family 39 protein n=1 Tax=Desulfomonile tiedjei TaxID=2358 RepID=A0A9D6UZF0_9BACT|nr:glycosyltransferase family 39 protein [Desulfomonile tiedjei]
MQSPHRDDQQVNPAGSAFAELGQLLNGLATKRRKLILSFVVAAGFCLIVNSSWNATPDSALYLTLGESIARGDGYVFNGEPHTFVPPGLPLILAGAARFLGPEFLYYRIVMALAGLLTAWFGYLFVARLCGQDTAFLVGGVFALNHILLFNSTFVLADVVYALFTLIALNAALSAAEESGDHSRLLIAGLIMGIPPLIRINGAAIPVSTAIFFYCAWKNFSTRKRLLRIALFLAISFIPFLLWQYWKSSFPVSESEGTYLNAVAGRRWDDQLRVIVTALMEYIPESSLALTGVSLKTGFLELPVPMLAVFGLFWAFRKGERLLVPLTVIQSCGLLLSSAGTRYLIFLLPGLYLFLALGALQLFKFLGRKFQSMPEPRSLLVGSFAVLALLNAGHNLGVVWSARTPLERNGAETERSLPFFTAARWLKENAPDATVLTIRPRIIHYLSGCRTVSLVRSGVPDHDIWLDTEERLKRMIRESSPDFLFVDSKDAGYYSHVTKVIERTGYKLEEINPEASSVRFRLFRLAGPEERPH